MRKLGVLFALLFAVNAQADVKSLTSTMKAHSFRLVPGQDLVDEITGWARKNQIHAAAIVTVVGSLKKVNIRFADKPETTSKEGPFEIVSMVGTFNDKTAHLHASLSDGKGATIGGHLMRGNLVYTTAEVVVAELPDVTFAREHDEASGYDELVVRKK